MGRPPHAGHPAALTRQSRVSRLWGAPDQVWAASNPYGPSLARKICRRQVKGLPARFGDGRPADDTSATLQRHFNDTSATLRRHFGDTMRRPTTLRRHDAPADDTSATLQRHFSDTSATLRRHFGDTSVPRAGPRVRGRPKLLRGSTGPSPALFFRLMGGWALRCGGTMGSVGGWGKWGGSGPVGRGLGAGACRHWARSHENAVGRGEAGRARGGGTRATLHLPFRTARARRVNEWHGGIGPPAGLVASLAEGPHLVLGMQNQGFANPK